MNPNKPSFQPLAFSLTVLAAMARLIPHPPNFAPVGSVALFGGARLQGWQAYLVPVLAMLITDPIRSRLEGYYAPYSWATLVIYSCFLVNVVLGRVFLRNHASAWRIAAVALTGSVQFYLITNLYEWWRGLSLYPHTLAGLATCYIAALPFFARTLFSDLFYSGVLFGAYAVLHRERRERQPATA